MPNSPKTMLQFNGTLTDDTLSLYFNGPNQQKFFMQVIGAGEYRSVTSYIGSINDGVTYYVIGVDIIGSKITLQLSLKIKGSLEKEFEIENTSLLPLFQKLKTRVESFMTPMQPQNLHTGFQRQKIF